MDKIDIGDDAGFTLVELLVALAVLALMSTYAVTTLQRFADIRRFEMVMSQNESLSLARQQMRITVGGMRASFDNNSRPENRLVFEGAPDHMRLSNVLDDRLEFGGLFVLDYGVTDQSLMLHYSRDGFDAGSAEKKSNCFET